VWPSTLSSVMAKAKRRSAGSRKSLGSVMG
jgi:hypothetical protein